MEIIRNELDNLVAEITLTLNPSDYKPEFDKEIKNLSYKAHLKGFRKGKTPLSAIIKMYGKSVLADILNKIISTEINGYIKEKEINMLGEPLPTSDFNGDDINTKEFLPLSFSFKIGYVPEFEIKGLEDDVIYESYEVRINKEIIEKEFQAIRKKYGTAIILDKTIEKNDFISLRVDELGEENIVLGNGLNSEFGILVDRLSDQYFDEFIGKNKGFQSVVSIMDLEKDVDRDFVMKYFLNTEADTNVNKYFLATVEGVKEHEPAELNEEFFTKAFPEMGITTEEEALIVIKEGMGTIYKDEGDQITQMHLLESLVNKNDFELPQDFLKEWLESSQEDEKSKISDKEYLNFEKQLRWSLISKSLGKKYNIDVQGDDMRAGAVEIVKQMLRSYNNYPGIDYDSLGELYLKDNPDREKEVYRKVYSEKIMENIMDSVTLRRKKIDMEEYDDLVKKMQKDNQ